MTFKYLALSLALCTTVGNGIVSSSLMAAAAVSPSEANYVMGAEETALLDQIKTDEKNGILDSLLRAIDAAKEGYLEIVAYLMNPARAIPPDQQNFTLTYGYAAEYGHLHILQYLDDPARPGRHLDQDGVNNAYNHVAGHGNLRILQYLDDPARALRPGLVGVNNAFNHAASNGHLQILEYVNNPDRPGIHPDQEGFNNALASAVEHAQFHVIQYLMDPARAIPPDQATIIREYRNAVAFQYPPYVIAMFEFFVPEEIRLEQQHRRARPVGGIGGAFEVHDYAGTMVNMPVSSASPASAASSCASSASPASAASSCASSASPASAASSSASSASPASAASSSASSPCSPPQLKLIDAVFLHMAQRLGSQVPMSLPEAEAIVNQAIEQFIASDQQAKAKQACFSQQDATYAKRLILAVTFIQKFHSAAMQQWIEGFVLESITAYNSQHSVSCTKGIGERILTGLRGIDEQLDTLFGQAEGPKAMKVFLNQKCSSIVSEPESQEWMAQELMQYGVTAASTAKQAAQAFRVMFNKRLSEYGISVDDGEFSATRESYVGLVESIFDTALKPLMSNQSSAAVSASSSSSSSSSSASSSSAPRPFVAGDNARLIAQQDAEHATMEATDQAAREASEAAAALAPVEGDKEDIGAAAVAEPQPQIPTQEELNARAREARNIMFGQKKKE